MRRSLLLPRASTASESRFEGKPTADRTGQGARRVVAFGVGVAPLAGTRSRHSAQHALMCVCGTRHYLGFLSPPGPCAAHPTPLVKSSVQDSDTPLYVAEPGMLDQESLSVGLGSFPWSIRRLRPTLCLPTLAQFVFNRPLPVHRFGLFCRLLLAHSSLGRSRATAVAKFRLSAIPQCDVAGLGTLELRPVRWCIFSHAPHGENDLHIDCNQGVSARARYRFVVRDGFEQRRVQRSPHQRTKQVVCFVTPRCKSRPCKLFLCSAFGCWPPTQDFATVLVDLGYGLIRLCETSTSLMPAYYRGSLRVWWSGRRP